VLVWTQGDILLLARALAEARGVKLEHGEPLGHSRHESGAIRSSR
jgi:hypothetical protein